MIEIRSSGIARIPFLEALLGEPVQRGGRLLAGLNAACPDIVAGWGARPSAQAARKRAERLGVPYWALEDGFLRSFGPGAEHPAVSMVVDSKGIYYDATRPSALECMLASDRDLLEGIEADVDEAMALIKAHRLSKYNHAGTTCPPLSTNGRKCVLVLDQTMGDMSVTLGGANAATFAEMLRIARREYPGALCIVKTHPEVSTGRKAGYLTHTVDDADTRVLREAVNPLALLEQVDHVYVVSSQMGYEGLLMNKPVTCLGMPWYAGWGLTQDLQVCPRRRRRRSVRELFAAAYFHYSRYLDPVSHGQGSIFDAIAWLLRQRAMAERLPRRMICVGYRRWKAANVRPMLGLRPGRVLFVADTRRARALAPDCEDALVHGGVEAPEGVAQLAGQAGCPVLRMEDGFVRSVGLGSDLIRPLSLSLDSRGMYFDPGRPSDLELTLSQARFTPAELATARRVRAFMVAHGITKYNLEPARRVTWRSADREVVLVPGQVEDDVSVRLGCGGLVANNLALLRTARAVHPDAYIVYKPHPDVASGNRRGTVDRCDLLGLADHVETEASVVSCIDACDVMHTMTSLAGFDALLRGKRVVVHGRPFYAGWGLTDDRMAMPRRRRRLTLDELVAGALLRYPIYWDWELKGYTTCEAVLNRIVEKRDALERQGRLRRLRVGYARRQWRKLDTLLRAQLTP